MTSESRIVRVSLFTRCTATWQLNMVSESPPLPRLSGTLEGVGLFKQHRWKGRSQKVPQSKRLSQCLNQLALEYDSVRYFAIILMMKKTNYANFSHH